MKGSSSGVFLITIFVCVWLIPFVIPNVDTSLPEWWLGSIEYEYTGGSMLFVGDIMLGRHVETLIEKKGEEYPFDGIRELVQSVDSVVGNFEAATPIDHKKTKDFNFNFSVDNQMFEILQAVGFDIFSLANNHSYDFGNEGYIHTIEQCYASDLQCFGHPYEVRDVSVGKVKVGQDLVGILYLHGIVFNQNDPELKKALNALFKETNFQIAYIHWGIEYEPKHDKKQSEIAHFLIDEGVDSIFGHHPHVVQDIELYKGKPIFYSLGNFIFDQYFSEEVENGLTVKMLFERNSVHYTLIPVTSVVNKSQPHIMSVTDKEIFFNKLIIEEQLSSIDAEDPTFVISR